MPDPASPVVTRDNIDRLVQERRNSSALATELGFLALTHRYVNLYPQDNIDRLVQERRNSSALAMELRLSCINQSIC